MPTERDLIQQLSRHADTVEVPTNIKEVVLRDYQRHVQQRGEKLRRPWRVLVASVGSVVVVGSGTLASGFASASVARVLQKLPIIGGVADALYAGAMPGVNRAVEHGFNIPINQSMTRKGITITVTNAYFGPDQLWIGMTESFAKSLKTHPRIHLGKVAFQVDGKTPSAHGVEFRPMADGTYAGDVNLRSIPANLPKTITATIGIGQIGGTMGNWHFTIHLSRQSADAATKTYLVSASKRIKGVSWNITRATVTPATVWVYGEITLPGHVFPNFFVKASPSAAGWTLGAPESIKPVRHTAMNTTWTFATSFERPETLGPSVTLEPVFYVYDDHALTNDLPGLPLDPSRNRQAVSARPVGASALSLNVPLK